MFQSFYSSNNILAQTKLIINKENSNAAEKPELKSLISIMVV